MPKVGPLSAAQARASLANRLSGRIDRVRQIATKLGVRPLRVFMTWVRFTGSERGEGAEQVIARVEILPTPRVSFNVRNQPYSAGILPDGVATLSLVSAAYTFDQLTGRMIPNAHEDHIPEPYDFFYELVEDGRGDPDPLVHKFRVSTQPVREAGRVAWTIGLERISEDYDRKRQTQIGDD